MNTAMNLRGDKIEKRERGEGSRKDGRCEDGEGRESRVAHLLPFNPLDERTH